MSLADIRIEECEWTVRSKNCLRNEPYRTLADLAKAPDSELLGIPNFGRRSLNEVRETIARHAPKFNPIPDPPKNSDIVAWALEHEHLIRALMYLKAEITIRIVSTPDGRAD